MTIVHLHGREHEAAVVGLLAAAQVHRTPEDALRRAPSIAEAYAASDVLRLWGYQLRGAVVGVVGVQVTGADSAVIRDLAVLAHERRRGVGRALVDFLRIKAAFSALEGDTLADAAPFYERCGFQIRDHGTMPDGATRYRFVWQHRGLPSDRDLLAVEVETLWKVDDRGRLTTSANVGARKAPLLVIAAARDGLFASFGSDVPDALAQRLRAAVAPDGPPSHLSQPPGSLAQCERLLTSELGPVQVSGGPGYLIPPSTAFASNADIHLSQGANIASLRSISVNRNAWSEDDWRLLLDGFYGPWAIATTGNRVASVCHSARLTDVGAEAGVWTDPDFRGRGHAAAVTAAWASLLAPTGRRLFYSTSSDNTSSQRVAARLGLPCIGWMWQLAHP